MTENEREKIKLRANYANGLALVFAGAGGVAPFLLFASKLDYRWIGLVFFAIGVWTSIELHGRGLRELDKLEPLDPN